MPRIYLSPSTQEWNTYYNGGTEEQYMNLVADRMEPYLRANGIGYTRNDPAKNVQGAINESNSSYYDLHLALHSNAAGEINSGKVRGIEVYYYPGSADSERFADIAVKNFKKIYPLPDRVKKVPVDGVRVQLGEVTQTKAPADLLEIGYHDNPEDSEWIKNNLTPIAKNITESLTEYFGIPFVNAGAVHRGYVNTDGTNLNMREKPTTESDVIMTIPDGSELTVYGKTGDWYSVNYNYRNGYVYADYVVLG